MKKRMMLTFVAVLVVSLIFSTVVVFADNAQDYTETKWKTYKYEGDTFTYTVRDYKTKNGKPTAASKKALPYGPGAYIDDDTKSKDTKISIPNKIGKNYVVSASVSIGTPGTGGKDRKSVTSLDVKSAKKLKSLTVGWGGREDDAYATGHKLTSIDVSGNKELVYLNIYCGSLKKIDLSKNTKLATLGLGENKLTELNVSKNVNLSVLFIADNKLTTVDLSKNTELLSLDTSSNKIKKLDLTNNKKLNDVNVDKSTKVTGYKGNKQEE